MRFFPAAVFISKVLINSGQTESDDRCEGNRFLINVINYTCIYLTFRANMAALGMFTRESLEENNEESNSPTDRQ